MDNQIDEVDVVARFGKPSRLRDVRPRYERDEVDPGRGIRRVNLVPLVLQRHHPSGFQLGTPSRVADVVDPVLAAHDAAR